jgi:hypothetical protein
VFFPQKVGRRHESLREPHFAAFWPSFFSVQISGSLSLPWERLPGALHALSSVACILQKKCFASTKILKITNPFLRRVKCMLLNKIHPMDSGVFLEKKSGLRLSYRSFVV